MPAGWNVRNAADGSILTWGGRAWDMRQHHGSLNDDQRLRVRQGMEDIGPRIGSGGQVVGQISGHWSLLPSTGQEAFDQYGQNAVLVYARPFNDPPSIALGYHDNYWQGGEYRASVVVFNSLQFDHPDMNTPAGFKNVAWHELGHVAGLLHPSSQTQVMSPNVTPLPWKSGDLAGFAALKAAR